MLDEMKAGEVRFLLVHSDKRYKDHPNLPTVGELVFPDAAMPSLCGICMCEDTPEPIEELLTEVSKNMSDDPKAGKSIKRLGGQPRCGG